MWCEVRTGMRWGGKGVRYQQWGTSFEYLGRFSVHRRSSCFSNCSEFCSLLVEGIYSALLSLALSLTLIYNPKLNPPYISTIQNRNPKLQNHLFSCLGTKAGLPGTKAVPWHQGRPSITVIRPQKALQLETLLGGLGGTPSRRRQTLTSDFKFVR
jgi:hypothetical protein